MDKMTILKDAFTAPDYPSMPHIMQKIDWNTFGTQQIMEVQWWDVKTGKIINVEYEDDVHSLTSRMLGHVTQKQLQWFEMFRAKVWLQK